MGNRLGETVDVGLSAENQMVLKYLVRLAIVGVPLEEIAIAVEYAFVGLGLEAALAIRTALTRVGDLRHLDTVLRGGGGEVLHLSVASTGQVMRAARAPAAPVA